MERKARVQQARKVSTKHKNIKYQKYFKSDETTCIIIIEVSIEGNQFRQREIENRTDL